MNTQGFKNYTNEDSGTEHNEVLILLCVLELLM